MDTVISVRYKFWRNYCIGNIMHFVCLPSYWRCFLCSFFLHLHTRCSLEVSHLVLLSSCHSLLFVYFIYVFGCSTNAIHHFLLSQSALTDKCIPFATKFKVCNNGLLLPCGERSMTLYDLRMSSPSRKNHHGGNWAICHFSLLLEVGFFMDEGRT